MAFTERVDWRGGEDEQEWLVLPISADEVNAISSCAEGDLAALLVTLGRDRRYLVRSFPSGGEIDAWWRQGGFAIGPHD